MSSSTVTIRPVQKKTELKKFMLFPWQIYKNDPNWVAPLLVNEKNLLDMSRNPFYQHSEGQYFLAYKNGEIVGRIEALINDNHNKFQEEKTGFFGFYESINDENVAKALFEAAENWIRERGMDRMRGPMNPSTNDTCGLLVDAFDQPPVLLMTYNPPYYQDLFEKSGLEKSKDLYAYYMDTSVPISDKIKRIAGLIKKRHKLEIRPANMKKLRQELEILKGIYNDAWSKNWGFVPMTEAEFDHLAKELKSIVVPELAIFAYVDGEPAGFSLALPDMNQAMHKINGRLLPIGLFKLLWYSRKIDLIRVIIMGIRKQFQKMGIDAVFYYETYVKGVEKGYTRGEFSWILEDNYPMRHSLENWGSKVYKTYRIYDKEF